MKIVALDVRRLAIRRFGDETAIVDLRGRTVHRLNATAAQLWEIIVRGGDHDALVRHLCETYEVESTEAAKDVRGLLRSLADAGLVRVEGMPLHDDAEVLAPVEAAE